MLFLFQGDSVTDCGRNRENEKSLGTGYPNLIASELLYDNPDKNYHFINKGISGNRIVDLYGRWREECINIKPDVLSILIGINDIWHEFKRGTGIEAPKFERVYDMLLEETKAKLPATRIVLCSPFVLEGDAPGEEFPAWKAELAGRIKIVESLAKKYDCDFIPLQDYFNEALKKAAPAYWLPDGVHPSNAGHELIARIWVKNFLK